MREKYETLSLTSLREIAKARNLTHISGLRKAELIDKLCELDEAGEASKAAALEKGAPKEETAASMQASTPVTEKVETPETRENSGESARSEDRPTQRQTRPMRRGERNNDRRMQRTDRQQSDRSEQRTDRQDRQQSDRSEQRNDRQDRQQNERNDRQQQNERSDRPPMDLAALDSGNKASGILEVMPDGYGFIRSNGYMPGETDVYVAPSQIRRFNLKTGDIVSGNTRIPAQQEKFAALLYVSAVNGRAPSEASRRRTFESMTPIFPDKRMKMESNASASENRSMRIVDLIAPIGHGQRGMIVSPPKAGKTTLLKAVAQSILRNDPSMHLMVMLIDERPEEVTDIREAIVGERVEVLASTFDEAPEHHIKVAEMGIARAKRLVEYGENVTILLDSITRLARASNVTIQPSGRTLSGGLDPWALNMPKRFFGAARNMREGGSLTILATALVDTGSKMDDVVYEEFKGTGNMELILDRKLSERRFFPAIDVIKSGTRREDLLLNREEQEAVYYIRRGLNGMKGEDQAETLLNLFAETGSNAELVERVRRNKKIQ